MRTILLALAIVYLSVVPTTLLAQQRCNCTPGNIKDACSATITISEDDQIKIISSSNQCSLVEWQLNGNLRFNIVEDGILLDNYQWRLTNPEPEIIFQDCNVCEDRLYSSNQSENDNLISERRESNSLDFSDELREIANNQNRSSDNLLDFSDELKSIGTTTPRDQLGNWDDELKRSIESNQEWVKQQEELKKEQERQQELAYEREQEREQQLAFERNQRANQTSSNTNDTPGFWESFTAGFIQEYMRSEGLLPGTIPLPGTNPSFGTTATASNRTANAQPGNNSPGCNQFRQELGGYTLPDATANSAMDAAQKTYQFYDRWANRAQQLGCTAAYNDFREAANQAAATINAIRGSR